ILLGGLVTNTGSALAVPDWPTTFGHNMFLYPWSRMVGGVFYEHSHRLVGAVVGLLTLLLAAALWPAGGVLRRLGLAAVLAVVAQGVLGVVHGCLAQAFFALLAVVALLTSPRAARPPQGIDPSVAPLAAVAAAAAYLQIVSGAFLTHLGRIDLHLLGAVVVFALVPVVTARLRRSGDPVAAPVARALLALLGLQLLLGAGSYLARFTPVWMPGGRLTMLVLPVSHRLVASLILGAAAVLAVRARAAAGAVAGGERRAGAPAAAGAGAPAVGEST